MLENIVCCVYDEIYYIYCDWYVTDWYIYNSFVGKIATSVKTIYLPLRWRLETSAFPTWSLKAVWRPFLCCVNGEALRWMREETAWTVRNELKAALEILWACVGNKSVVWARVLSFHVNIVWISDNCYIIWPSFMRERCKQVRPAL